MNETLKIIGLQPDLIWESPSENMAVIEQLISEQLASNTSVDLIVLPETFTSGFSMNLDQIAVWEDSSTLDWMKRLATTHNVAITGSISFRFPDDTARNRCLFVPPSDENAGAGNGEPIIYDKRHLFTYGGEGEHFEKGIHRVVAKFRNWNILLQICYDLRFPCFARNTEYEAYDIAIYMANWPAIRRHQWKTLLQARAMENQCYVLGVNRTGEDKNEIIYSGDSLSIDPVGNIISDAENGIAVEMICNRSVITNLRAEFPALKDAD